MSELENVPGSPSPAASAPAAPAPAAPAIPSAAPAAAPATTSATPQAPASGAPPVEPSWLKGRLEETRQAALRQANAEFARREAEYQAQMQQIQRQLHAVVGVTPPADPQAQSVRDQFAQLYPGLSKIEERAEQLLGVLERSGDLESQTNHYWQSYGRQTMNRLFEKASESLGGPLSDGAKRQLHQAFTGYVSSSPEATARYTNDPTIVDEFWNDFTSSFVNPSRRVAAAAPELRAQTPLPSNAPSGAPALQQAPQPANLDQRAAQGWAAYNHALQNKGQQ